MKITLANLHEATEQQVFDQVAEHLLKQNARSLDDNEDGCMYRGANSLQCAAGCLIADDEYRPSLENLSWNMLVKELSVPSEHSSLILELQKIHDENTTLEWKSLLRLTAEDNNLTWKFETL